MNSIDFDKSNRERHQFYFEKMVADFIDRYAPRENAEFSARLMMIVRQSFQDGGEEANKNLRAVLATVPYRVITEPTNKNKEER